MNNARVNISQAIEDTKSRIETLNNNIDVADPGYAEILIQEKQLEEERLNLLIRDSKGDDILGT